MNHAENTAMEWKPNVYMAGKVGVERYNTPVLPTLYYSSSPFVYDKPKHQSAPERVGLFEIGCAQELIQFATTVKRDMQTYFHVGPWAICCQHGVYQRCASHAMARSDSGSEPVGCAFKDMISPSSSTIWTIARRNIERADIIVTRITSDDAYGTLVECGMANALNKPLLVDISANLTIDVIVDHWFVVETAIDSLERLDSEERERVLAWAHKNSNALKLSADYETFSAYKDYYEDFSELASRVLESRMLSRADLPPGTLRY